MVLVPCPKCGKEISDRARSCPNCRLSLNAEPEPRSLDPILELTNVTSELIRVGEELASLSNTDASRDRKVELLTERNRLRARAAEVREKLSNPSAPSSRNTTAFSTDGRPVSRGMTSNPTQRGMVGAPSSRPAAGPPAILDIAHLFWILFLAGAVVVLLISATDYFGSGSSARGLLLASVGPLLFVLFFGVELYWSPSVIAATRMAPNRADVYWINFLLGWTVIGWIVALAMAYSHPAPYRWRRRSGQWSWEPRHRNHSAPARDSHRAGAASGR